MVSTPNHLITMADAKAMAQKITPEMLARRAPHLAELERIETLVRKASPLPIAYDVTRQQPPYFNEFTYTELMGGIFVAPQSTEAAARLVLMSARAKPGHDPIPHLAYADKYTPTAQRPTKHPTSVVIIPGSNIFAAAVSREALTSAMANDPDALIKPHPMTAPDLIRDLGREFGYHRILEPDASGYSLVREAERVYSVQGSELGLYAHLADIEVHDITRPNYRCQCSYHPFYLAAKEGLLKEALRGPYSGFFHPSNSNVKASIDTYFTNAMRLRETLKPVTSEFGPIEWGQAIQLRQGRATLTTG